RGEGARLAHRTCRLDAPARAGRLRGAGPGALAVDAHRPAAAGDGLPGLSDLPGAVGHRRFLTSSRRRSLMFHPALGLLVTLIQARVARAQRLERGASAVEWVVIAAILVGIC